MAGATQLNEASWRMLSGTTSTDVQGACGPPGQFSITYSPGSRHGLAMAVSDDGNVLYTAFGSGKSASSTSGRLNDVWAYRQTVWSSHGEWAWLSGSTDSVDLNGQTEAPTPFPGSRYYTTIWYHNDTIYVFGGLGDAIKDAEVSRLDDIWRLSLSNLAWEWIGGTGDAHVEASFKPISSSESPGGIYGQSILSITNQTVLVFGGSGRIKTEGLTRDIWLYSMTNRTWNCIHGPKDIDENSICGQCTPNVFDSSNNPGARMLVECLNPSHPIIYIYAGYGRTVNNTATQYLADLWAFDTARKQWAFMGGESAVAGADAMAVYGSKFVFGTGHPGAFGSGGSWIDPFSDLLFTMGGECTAGRLSALWAYNVTTQLWAWAGGLSTINSETTVSNDWFSVSNQPGGRGSYGSVVSDSNGLMYMFAGKESVNLNTLWATRGPNMVVSTPTPVPSPTPTPTPTPLSKPAWRRVSGSVTSTNLIGVCGSAGQFDPSHVPGGRFNSAITRGHDVTYVFGGVGRGTVTDTVGSLADVWAYRQTSWSSIGEWAWLGGVNDTVDYPGVYTNASDAHPGSRFGAIMWYTEPDDLRVFGGEAFDGQGQSGFMNDMWAFNTSSLSWKHIMGSSLHGALSTFGMITMAQEGNTPGGVKHPALLLSDGGNMRYFGGYGIGSSPGFGLLQFVWRFDGQHWAWMKGTSSSIGQSSYGGDSGVFNTNYVPGAREKMVGIEHEQYLYLYGGIGKSFTNEGKLADLWAYKQSINEFAYIAGESILVNTHGSYLPGRMFNAMSYPGSHETSCGWPDPNNKYLIMVMGGTAEDEYDDTGGFNDFWAFNTSLKLWAWVDGGSLRHQWTELNVTDWFSTKNTPGSVNGHVSWSMDGVMAYFGGYAWNTGGTHGYSNAVWETKGPTMIIPETMPTPSPSVTPIPRHLRAFAWRLMSGSEGLNSQGSYGNAGQFSSSFSPSARMSAASCVVDEVVHIMGGTGIRPSSLSLSGNLGDWWAYRQPGGWSAKGEWAWMGGSLDINIGGTYTGSVSPGARFGHILTRDAREPHNLVMGFGIGYDGTGEQGKLNDLWRLYPATRTVEWISGSSVKGQSNIVDNKGTSSPLNQPGGTQDLMIMALDSFFGGSGRDNDTKTGVLSMVWRYDGSWTYLNGDWRVNSNSIVGDPGTFTSEHHPGGRDSSATVRHGSMVWLYGGYGRASQGTNVRLSDLWCYSIDQNKWAFIKGDSTGTSGGGIFGYEGQFDPMNHPSARYRLGGWVDPYDDHLIGIYGGFGVDADMVDVPLSDTWMFNISTNNWAWANGMSTAGSHPAVYNDDVWFNLNNAAGGRQRQTVFTIPDLGLTYVFGGTRIGYKNDLMATRGGMAATILASPTPSPSPSPSPTPTPTSTPLNPVQWRWLSGSSLFDQEGQYGAKGQFSAAYNPGSRRGSAMSITGQDIYLSGGVGRGAAGSLNLRLGDVWIFRQQHWSGKGEWAWVGGHSATQSYHCQLAGPTPYPGARVLGLGWYQNDRFYIHGGDGMASTGSGLLGDLWAFSSADYTWEYLKGSSLVDSSAVYGEKGHATNDTDPGGVRSATLLVTRPNSVLIFGGRQSNTGWTSVLWQYNSTANNWAWLNGPSVANSLPVYGPSGDYSTVYHPGSMSGACSMDSGDIVYIFGGFNGTGYYGTLWGFKVATNEWAFITGRQDEQSFDTNPAPMRHFSIGYPAARISAAGWKDPGSDLIYMFGGSRGYLVGTLSDLWAFNVSKTQWMWAAGSTQVNQASVFGTSNWFSDSEMPGCRKQAGAVASSTYGLMYLFAGMAETQSPNDARCDMWVTRGSVYVIGASPTPTLSPSPSPSPSPSSSPTSSPTPSPSPSPPPVLLSLEPRYGPTSGSTSLVIHGDELHLMGPSMTVVFQSGSETHYVSGQRIGLTEIRCLTPPFSTAANVTVTVQGSWSTLVCAEQFNYYSNLTLTRAHPPLAVRTGGQLILIEGENIPNTGSYFTVRLTDSYGNNVTTTVASYRFNNGTYFTAPSFAAHYDAAASSTYDVTLDVAPNGQQYFEGQSLAFKYYVLPSLSTVDPQQMPTRGGKNVTVTGTGFFPSDWIVCRYSVETGKGYYVSKSEILCSVPQVETGGTRELTVSMDDGSIYTTTGVSITLVEYVSEECRAKGELSAFKPDREQLGLFYLENLAIGATVTTSSRRDDYDSSVGRSLDPSQIVDGDRCCEYTVQTLGYKCGVVFSVNSSLTELASVTVDLGYEAYVDEVLTTWFRPCKNLPDPGYMIETRTTSDWVILLNRAVWKEYPCRTMTGDDGPTAFCADFFQPIVARQFRLTFNNSVDHFAVGSGTDGGWLMEFEVHGIFLKTPYQLRIDTHPLAVTSGITVPVPPIVVESLSILDGAMNASDPDASRPVTVSIQGPKQCLTTVPITPVQGWHNFSSLTLERPTVGIYSLIFSSTGLRSANTTIVVSQGTAAYLIATTVSKTYPSADTVTLDPFVVKAYDEGSNWCSLDSVVRNVTVKSVNTSTILGWGTMTNGQATVSGIKLDDPTTGIHLLAFETGGLKTCEIGVPVGIGDPVQLSLDAYDTTSRKSTEIVMLPSFNVKLHDAGGALVTNPTHAVQVDVTLIESVSAITGNVSQVTVNGVAFFNSLYLLAPPAGTYQLKFTSLTLPQSPLLTATVTVVPGPATSIFVQNYTSSEYGSAVFTRLEPITLGALDAGGNRVFVDRTVFATLSPHPETLSGQTVVEMINGTATMSNVTILSPATGDYTLNFSIAGLKRASMVIKVAPGAAVSLKITQGSNQTHDSLSLVTLDTIQLVSIDAGGSLASTSANVTVRCTTASLDGTVRASLDGSASLSNVRMRAPKAGVYVLTIESSTGLITAQATVYIRVGPPYRLTVDKPDSAMCVPKCEVTTGSILCCRSAGTTQLPVITVKTVDAGGDWSKQDSSITVVTLFNESSVWTGNKTMPVVNGVAMFSNLMLHKPKTGRYVIGFVSSSIVGDRLALDIEVGEPAGIIVTGGPTAVPYPCLLQTILNNVTAQLLDSGGTIITEPAGTVTLALTAHDANGVPVLSTQNSYVTPSHNTAVWTGLSLGAPKIGTIHVVVSGPTPLIPDQFTVSITNGPPYSFTVSLALEPILHGATKVYLPPLLLEEEDAGGNPAALGPNRTVTASMPLLGGQTQWQMVGSKATLNNMYLLMPPRGTYPLQLNVTGLPTTSIEFDVVSGLPHQLVFEGVSLPTISDNTNQLDTPITVVVQDGAGNPVDQSVTVKVSLLNTNNNTVPGTLDGTTSIPDTRRAIFNDLFLRGGRGETYTLLFFIDGSPNINVNLSIPIESCEAHVSGSIAIPPEYRTCECPAGWTGTSKCVQCAEGKFKGSIGPYQCAPCKLALTTSAKGATSENYCKCEKGTYFKIDVCLPCETGATCPGGDLTKPLDPADVQQSMGPINPVIGYWRAQQAEPWDIFKCPSDTACAGGVNGSQCDPFYRGPLCSLCVNDYALQGSVCYKCAEMGANVAILITAVVVLGFLLRYYVRKQMLGGRSPEATVLKVIINYVQVIAFVGSFRAKWKSLMSGFYMSLGAAANIEVLSIQPIDCVFRANFYGYFFFYISLVGVSFLLPWIMYSLAFTMKRFKPLSTAPPPLPHGPTSRNLDVGTSRRAIALWPIKLFFLGVLPSIPRFFSRVWRGFKRWLSRRFTGVIDYVAGEHLEEEREGQGEDVPVSDVEGAATAMARRQAKRVGAVLFEEDPMLGREAISVTKSTFWILFFLLLPTIIKNTMELFNCREISGIEYIDRDLSIECGTSMHTGLIYFFWIGVVPMLSVLLLYVVYKNVIIRKRRQLVRYLPYYNMCYNDQFGRLCLPPGTDEKTAQVLRREKTALRRLRKYLFLFSGYRTEGVLYMWDLVILSRKIAIAAILVFARHQIVLQIFLGLLVFVIALILHMRYKPFDDEYARQKQMRVLPSTLEFISIIATIFTLLAGLLFSVQEQVLTVTAAQVLDWIVLIVNLIVLLAFVMLLFDALRSKISIQQQLRSSRAQMAAKWWKSHVGCCEWGVVEKGTEVEMGDMGSSRGRAMI